MNPRWPIYIPSKGRADSCLTMRHLDSMRVPYLVIVEEEERAAYARTIDPSRLLVLDPSYQERYDPFDDDGLSKSIGSGPARNFAWDHAVAAGWPWHWIVDDNIKGWFRFNHNLKVPCADGTVLRCMEDFVERYRNIAMAGPHYFMFVSRKQENIPPFVLNTRIFSCNLIRNDVPFRWRCRYNEDLDLSLRMLKAGWCTVLFNAFLQYKLPTQMMGGGNTEAFYSREGTLPKSQMIVRAHPDVARLAWKFGRWHHQVDYSSFKRNKLLRRDDVRLEPGVDNYGMVLRRRDDAA